MVKTTPRLDWCIVRLGRDMNWWVEETSDPVHWDTIDGLSIMDPRQMTYLIDAMAQLERYGLQISQLNRAFYKFKIEERRSEGSVRLARVQDSLLNMSEEEPLFALPDVVDEEKGPYADLLNQVTRARVKMLNDLIDFEEHLTIEELEEEIRDQQAQDYLEGKSVHLFTELCSIIEYVPVGYELDLGEEEETAVAGDKEYEEEFPDLEETDEKIEQDETMKWGDEDEELDEEAEEEMKLFKVKVTVKGEKSGKSEKESSKKAAKPKKVAKKAAKPAKKVVKKAAKKPVAKKAVKKVAKKKAPAKKKASPKKVAKKNAPAKKKVVKKKK